MKPRLRLPEFLRGLFQKDGLDEDLEMELRSHVEMQTLENIGAGMTPGEARRAALRTFGASDSIKEQCREERAAAWIGNVARDLRLGLRILRRNPGFAAVSVLSLAVGIAVNVVVFSFLNALVFRQPPGVVEPDRLFSLRGMAGGIPYSEFEFLRKNNTVYSAMAASAPCRTGVRLDYTEPRRGADEPVPPRKTEYPAVRFVSGDYFRLIGVRFTLGRGFLPDEDRISGERPAVVLSRLFWERGFNSDPAIVGRTVTLNRRACTVVGVAPGECPREPGVFAPPAAWVPISMQDELDPGQSVLRPPDGSPRGVCFYGRLKPNTTPAGAEAELSVLDEQFAREYFDPKEPRFPWTKFMETGFAFLPWRPAPVKLIVLLTLSVGGMVLLVACANVASLLLARAGARRREIGVRLALGAGRLRLILQLATESMMIACAGGALGLLAGSWAAMELWPRFTAGVLPAGLGECFNFGLDWRVIRHAAALTLAAGAAFGLGPALNATRTSVKSAPHREGRFLGRRLPRPGPRGLLIVGQIAVSLTLLIGAALMLRRVQTGLSREYAFETRRVLMVDFSTPAQNIRRFQQALVERIRALPGVRAAALGQVWYADSVSSRNMRVDGKIPGTTAGLALSRVTPEYFGTLGVAIPRGRNFTPGEAAAEAPVLIVSESFAKKFYPGVDSLGRRLRIGETNIEAVIIGVARDGAREIRSQYELQPYPGDLYAPLSPTTARKVEVWVRTEGNPFGVLPLVQKETASLDDTVRLGGRRLGDLAAAWVGPMAFLGGTVGVLGALALILASVGVYGVVAYAVVQRTQEIGIRAALGARDRNITTRTAGCTTKVDEEFWAPARRWRGKMPAAASD